MALFKNSLYRYYRPIDFIDFVGQKNVVKILTNQIKDNSFSHAILFTGPRGCGKTSLARIFAKAINCEVNKNSTEKLNVPCNQCSHCLNVQENRALNIIELDGASNNGVEEVRHLIENSRLTPVGAAYKIFIIDEVHMLSKGAFNALLKTLEEPPNHIVFILATTELDKIPMTIISRCQIFNLHKINQPDMVARLMKVARAENIKLDEQAANEIFYLSEGSLRDALNVLQQLIATKSTIINLNLVQDYFQIPTQKDKINILKNLLKNQAQELINYFETIHDRGLNLDLFILGLLDLIKEIIEFRLTKDSKFLKKIDLNETTILEADISSYFLIGDALSEAFQKNNNLSGDYNYVLINLLKTIHKLPSPAKETKVKANPKSLKFYDFLKQRENWLSKPRQMILPLCSNDQIFNILMAHSKDKRDEVVSIIEEIFAKNSNQDLIDPDLAKTFISWYKGEIVAVSDCEILIRFEDEEELKFFQEEIKNNFWQKNVEVKFKSPYVVYGIDRKHWEILKQEYMLAKSNNNLPQHQHVTWDLIYNSPQVVTHDQEDFVELANHLFGDLVEFEEENLPSK